MTVTGFAMPMTAYGAEEVTEQTANTVETQAEEVQTEEQTEELEAVVEEEELEEAVVEEEQEEEIATAEETEQVTEDTAAEEAAPEEEAAPAAEMKVAAPAAAEPVAEAEAVTLQTETTVAKAETTTETTMIDRAPTGLQAVSASYSSIKLTWNSVSGVKRYRVYVSSDMQTWKKYKTVSKTSCTVENLPTKRTRYFKVVSVVKGSNVKKASEIVSAKARMDRPVLHGELASDKLSVTLNWTYVPGAAGYKVYRYNAATKSYKKVKTIKSGSTLSCEVATVPGYKNKFKVRAYRKSEGSKVYSKRSKAVKFDLSDEDATSLQFKAGSTSLTSAKRTGKKTGKLSWKKVSGASGYSIYRYVPSKGTYVRIKDVDGANTVKTTVKVGTKQTTFKVRAYKDYKGRRIRNSSSSAKHVEKYNNKGEKIIATGKSKLGCPYVWGACGPNAFDCSGFVMWVMRQHGISLPHNAASQYYALSSKNIGTNWRNAKPGDIVFYSYGGPGSSHHVGLYAGNGKLMHASSSHGRVVITSVTYTNGHIAAICRP